MVLQFRSLGMAVAFLLVLGIASGYGRIAGAAVIEVTSGDLTDDPATADSRKTAREKVQAKIDRATAGDVVQFPDGSFKDVGELLVTTSGGDGDGEEIVLRGNVEDPSAVRFTGKIMINVKASNVVVEGFTFEDTKIPDTITFKRLDQDDDDGNDRNHVAESPHSIFRKDLVGTIWIHTRYMESGTCPGEFAGAVTNVRILNNVLQNTETYGVLAEGRGSSLPEAPSNSQDCGSSEVVVSGNTFTGIGMNGDYLRLGDRREPDWGNLKSAVKAFQPNRITITSNVIDGTTYAGIMLNEVFGKTVVEYNEVKNIPAYGIRIKGNKNVDSDYEVVVSNNRVTNTNNNPYILRKYSEYRGEADNFKRTATGLTDKRVDEILKPQIWRVSAGADFYLPDTGGVPISVFASTEYDASDARVAATSSEIPQSNGGLDGTDGDLTTKRPCGDGSELVRSDGMRVVPEGTTSFVPPTLQPWWDDFCYALVRFIEPNLDSAIVLGGVTANTIRIENNEITGNTVGLLICESSNCSFRYPFNPLGSPVTGARGPTVIRGNNIYGNDNSHVSVYGHTGDVVNAIEGDGKELDLSGNYLGENPFVLGNVRSLDDSTLATEPFDLSATTGPDGMDPPGLAGAGGATFSGTTITLEYDEVLDEESVPAAAAFTVTQADSAGLTAPIGVTGVSVSGTRVTLTLARAPGSGNRVTVSYDPAKAGSGTGRGPIRDVVGNEAPALTSRMLIAPGPTDPVAPDQMGPGESQQPATSGGDGGCALASGGSDGAELGMPLLSMLAVFAFGLRRSAGKEK